jgi:hypothetical protein
MRWMRARAQEHASNLSIQWTLTRDVGHAAQGIDLKIMVEDHAGHLFEFMRWQEPQRSQTHKRRENMTLTMETAEGI